MASWRGVKSLVHDAVDATTHLVEEGHASVARSVRRVTEEIEPVAAPAATIDEVRRLVTAGILGSVRGVNRLVEGISDAGIDAFVAQAQGAAQATAPIPMVSNLFNDSRLLGDAALGFVNGAIGDHLATTRNSLDMGLRLRRGDTYLPDHRLTDVAPTRRAVVLVHGLSTTEWSWCLDAEKTWGDPATNFGALLERELRYTAVFVRYNTGKRVSTNGAALAEALETLVQTWPGGLDELVLLGHSMGGLVARSAGAVGVQKGHRWPKTLTRVIALGTPHQGAPLARFGEFAGAGFGAIDLPATRIISRLIGGRSAGIRDLEQGTVSEDGTEVPLLDGVDYHFIAGSIAGTPEHLVGAWVGDLLVQKPSAHGPRGQSGSPRVFTAFVGGVKHHQLQNDRRVYAEVKAACEATST